MKIKVDLTKPTDVKPVCKDGKDWTNPLDWHGHVRSFANQLKARCGGPNSLLNCPVCAEERDILESLQTPKETSMKISVSFSEKADLTQVPKKHRKKLKQLFNGLREEAAIALLAGKDIPETFDLCSITVPGTNLFCSGNKGLPRSMMPQLKGFPVAGSRAEEGPLDKNGKFDASELFLEMLEEQKVKTKRYRIDPTKLKATQNQLVGAKIAVRVGDMQNNPNHKKFKMPYFISKDGYILDGHHGWASVLSYCLLERKTLKINVIEVDMKIKKLVRIANQFMKDVGIAAKTAGGNNNTN